MNRARIFLTRPPHCEPPLGGLGADAPTPAVEHTRQLHAPRRTPHSGRSATQDTHDVDAADRMATQRFAEHSLRLALEVLDRRRTPDRLRAVCSGPVIDALRSRAAGEIPGRRLGAAVLGPVHMQPLDDAAIEVFATYTRGFRVFAIAGRITIDRPGDSWRMTSLHVG